MVRVDGVVGSNKDSGLEIGLVPELAVIYLALQEIARTNDEQSWEWL